MLFYIFRFQFSEKKNCFHFDNNKKCYSFIKLLSISWHKKNIYCKRRRGRGAAGAQWGVGGVLASLPCRHTSTKVNININYLTLWRRTVLESTTNTMLFLWDSNVNNGVKRLTYLCP